MSSEQQTFLKKVKNQHQHFLTGYFVGGDPSFEESIKNIKCAVDKGLDAIEIGIPSSDPFLEGEVIKRAHKRTIDHFNCEAHYVAFLKALRAEISVPIWIMGYTADIVHSNLYKVLSKDNLTDGFIIPDITVLDASTLKKELHHVGNQFIPVVNEGMNNEVIMEAVDGCKIVYCQIYKGKTGSAIKSLTTLPSFFQRVRSLTDATLMAGFGVKNAQVARQVLDAGFNGVVVGSEIVRLLEEDRTSLGDFIQDLASCKGNGGADS
ncbi:MAG: tryptophan synthase subunit alpha [Bacillus sp. (in: Bacteria)]|nr:tryptophan synthase subunit alpha [Bacillus sp. (in: firmicutes)]